MSGTQANLVDYTGQAGLAGNYVVLGAVALGAAFIIFMLWLHVWEWRRKSRWQPVIETVEGLKLAEPPAAPVRPNLLLKRRLAALQQAASPTEPA